MEGGLGNDYIFLFSLTTLLRDVSRYTVFEKFYTFGMHVKICEIELPSQQNCGSITVPIKVRLV